MKNKLRTLQTNLAKDLVKMENSGTTKKTMKMVEKVYNKVYKTVQKLDKKSK